LPTDWFEFEDVSKEETQDENPDSNCDGVDGNDDSSDGVGYQEELQDEEQDQTQCDDEIYIDDDSARPDWTKKVLDEPTDHWSEVVIQEVISAVSGRDLELNCEVKTDCHLHVKSSADEKIELSTEEIVSFGMNNKFTEKEKDWLKNHGTIEELEALKLIGQIMLNRSSRLNSGLVTAYWIT
jgi:hypothetical protein